LFFHFLINSQKLPSNENRICVIFIFFWGRPKTKITNSEIIIIMFWGRGGGEKLGKCHLYFWGKCCPSTYLLDEIEGKKNPLQ